MTMITGGNAGPDYRAFRLVQLNDGMWYVGHRRNQASGYREDSRHGDFDMAVERIKEIMKESKTQ